MAKHPVPKKKTPKSKSAKRHGSFQTKVLRDLTDRVSLTTCSSCGAKRRTHHACLECGMYRGKLVIDKSKKVENVTKIKV